MFSNIQYRHIGNQGFLATLVPRKNLRGKTTVFHSSPGENSFRQKARKARMAAE